MSLFNELFHVKWIKKPPYFWAAMVTHNKQDYSKTAQFFILQT